MWQIQLMTCSIADEEYHTATIFDVLLEQPMLNCTAMEYLFNYCT